MIINSFSGKYSFLSNFYQYPFTWNGLSAASSEHHFQAAKAVHRDEYLAILTAPTPARSKELGRRCQRREDWDEIKIGVMKSILIAKFEASMLRQMLIDTGDAELVEGNTWNDTFWGVCKGRGQNHLGKLLMEVRRGYRNNP